MMNKIINFSYLNPHPNPAEAGRERGSKRIKGNLLIIKSIRLMIF
jgi:hypothetical protein